jgi:hypothetical protein
MTTSSLSRLSLTLVEPSDEMAIRQWYELRCAVVHADLPADPPPCWIHQLGSVRHPLARLDAQARARSQGYSLVQWGGSTPQRWLDDIAYLTGG